MIDQSSFLNSPRLAARFDLTEMISGLLLVFFMWGHMLMLSTILFGPETMNSLAIFLEEYYLAQIGAAGVAALVLVHFLTAGRKLPSRVAETRALWKVAVGLRHLDTWLWVVQAVTGIMVLIFASIHLWYILTTFPIQAAKSSIRVAESLGYLYAPMIVAVELHVGVGFYRVLVKWTAIHRRNLSIIKWGLTVAFLAIGYAILAGFWTYGNQLLGS